MSMIFMVSPVADSPSMVQYENGRMQDMSHNIIEIGVVGEAPIATIMAKNKNCPELQLRSCTNINQLYRKEFRGPFYTKVHADYRFPTSLLISISTEGRRIIMPLLRHSLRLSKIRRPHHSPFKGVFMNEPSSSFKSTYFKGGHGQGKRSG
ncbi:hypothetical protein Fot_19625 [Forsythia ovata]|uniref:Ribosomal protein S11 n=1 Tax=Forsythia ovata TaxID=205694 RepID=A0ABD1VLL0_9LAMI